MKILCIIPARSGSKGIKDKNIKLFNKKPLLVWSIEHAKSSSYIDNMRIIVSTDSLQYAKIAKKYGAEVPFLRPKEISEDLSIDKEFIIYTVNRLKKENYYPDIILQLRPTYPLRKKSILDDCLKKFIENYNNYDSLRTVVKFNKSPFKMYTLVNNNLKPLFKNIDINNKKYIEPFNECRQLLPQVYLHNGYIDIIKTEILKNNVISGDKIYGYLMDENEVYDIDSIKDWELCEKLINFEKKKI